MQGKFLNSGLEGIDVVRGKPNWMDHEQYIVTNNPWEGLRDEPIKYSSRVLPWLNGKAGDQKQDLLEWSLRW